MLQQGYQIKNNNNKTTKEKCTQGWFLADSGQKLLPKAMSNKLCLLPFSFWGLNLCFHICYNTRAASRDLTTCLNKRAAGAAGKLQLSSSPRQATFSRDSSFTASQKVLQQLLLTPSAAIKTLRKGQIKNPQNKQQVARAVTLLLNKDSALPAQNKLPKNCSYTRLPEANIQRTFFHFL